MTMQDPIADMFTRIRNGLSAAKTEVTMNASNLKAAIAKVLQDEGYVKGFKVEGDKKRTLTIDLKYYDEKPVIRSIQRISRPSLRRYEGSQGFPKAAGGLGIVIVSTSKGVMTAVQAAKLGVGGETIGMVE